MSKYDFGSGKMYPGKMERKAEEMRPNQVQGCGDPNCEMCMPRNGRSGSGLVGGPPSGMSGFDRNIYERMRRAAAESYMYSGGPGQAPSRSDLTQTAEYRNAKEKVENYLLETPHDLDWSDVIGNEAARDALIEAIEAPTKHAALYAHYNMRPLKGVLLYGPPGCGKTMFGKVAASVVGRMHGKNALLLKINGPEIQSPYVGQTEQIIRDIFGFARLYAKANGHPLTVFIDEADSIMPSREGMSAGNFHASNVAAFLAEMDGLEANGAFVILATNRPEALDSALLRDGRCDRKIKIERPTRAAATAILRKALAAWPEADSLTHHAIEALYSPEHVFASLTVKNGKDQRQVRFCLHHIVNGAMVVGIAERAKGIAFRRDLAAGTITGVMVGDLIEAVAQIAKENAGIDQSYALREFTAAMAEMPLFNTIQ